MSGYGKCPRCGCLSLEHLRTHSYCWECNFSPDTNRMQHLNIIDDDDDESKLKSKKYKRLDDDEIEEDQDNELDYEEAL